MIIKLPFSLPFNIAAITMFPFIFISKGINYNDDQMAIIVKHERVHLSQQRPWAIYGIGIGLLVWYFLYEFCLPIWYNHWRRKWETQAYKEGDGLDNQTIDIILQGAPYWLRSNKK